MIKDDDLALTVRGELSDLVQFAATDERAGHRLMASCVDFADHATSASACQFFELLRLVLKRPRPPTLDKAWIELNGDEERSFSGHRAETVIAIRIQESEIRIQNKKNLESRCMVKEEQNELCDGECYILISDV